MPGTPPPLAQLSDGFALAAGVAMVTVHGRTRVQLYTGSADWELIAAVKQAVEIPVVGSGDVVSVAGARERLAISGVDALAIGRGAMANPWLFAEIKADLAGCTLAPPPVERRIAALRRYRTLLDEQYPEKVTAARLRGMACRTMKGFPGSALLREKASHTRSSDAQPMSTRNAIWRQGLRPDRGDSLG